MIKSFLINKKRKLTNIDEINQCIPFKPNGIYFILRSTSVPSDILEKLFVSDSLEAIYKTRSNSHRIATIENNRLTVNDYSGSSIQGGKEPSFNDTIIVFDWQMTGNRESITSNYSTFKNADAIIAVNRKMVGGNQVGYETEVKIFNAKGDLLYSMPSIITII